MSYNIYTGLYEPDFPVEPPPPLDPYQSFVYEPPPPDPYAYQSYEPTPLDPYEPPPYEPPPYVSPEPYFGGKGTERQYFAIRSLSPDEFEPEANEVLERAIGRHGGDYAPDLLQREGLWKEPLTRNINPDFSTIRGGPAMVPGGGGMRQSLADALEREGTPAPLVDEIRTRPVGVEPRSGPPGIGTFTPSTGRIHLPELDKPDGVSRGVVRHEAVHGYDWRQGPESGPGQGLSQAETPRFIAAVKAAVMQYLEQSQYFLTTVPKNDPNYFPHVFTAAFDTGRVLSEIPPPLKKFYEGLLPVDRPLAEPPLETDLPVESQPEAGAEPEPITYHGVGVSPYAVEPLEKPLLIPGARRRLQLEPQTFYRDGKLVTEEPVLELTDAQRRQEFLQKLGIPRALSETIAAEPEPPRGPRGGVEGLLEALPPTIGPIAMPWRGAAGIVGQLGAGLVGDVVTGPSLQATGRAVREATKDARRILAEERGSFGYGGSYEANFGDFWRSRGFETPAEVEQFQAWRKSQDDLLKLLSSVPKRVAGTEPSPRTKDFTLEPVGDTDAIAEAEQRAQALYRPGFERGRLDREPGVPSGAGRPEPRELDAIRGEQEALARAAEPVQPDAGAEELLALGVEGDDVYIPSGFTQADEVALRNAHRTGNQREIDRIMRKWQGQLLEEGPDYDARTPSRSGETRGPYAQFLTDMQALAGRHPNRQIERAIQAYDDGIISRQELIQSIEETDPQFKSGRWGFSSDTDVQRYLDRWRGRPDVGGSIRPDAETVLEREMMEDLLAPSSGAPAKAPSGPAVVETPNAAEAIALDFRTGGKGGKPKPANAAEGERALKKLENDGWNVEDAREKLDEYQSIKRGDFDDSEDYLDARKEAWGSFLDQLEGAVPPEAAATGPVSPERVAQALRGELDPNTLTDAELNSYFRLRSPEKEAQDLAAAQARLEASRAELLREAEDASVIPAEARLAEPSGAPAVGLAGATGPAEVPTPVGPGVRGGPVSEPAAPGILPPPGAGPRPKEMPLVQRLREVRAELDKLAAESDNADDVRLVAIFDRMAALDDMRAQLEESLGWIDRWEDELRAIDEAIESDPIRRVADRLTFPTGEIPESVTVAQFRDLQGHAPPKNIVNKGRIPIEFSLDEAANRYGFANDIELRRAVDSFNDMRRQRADLGAQLARAAEDIPPPVGESGARQIWARPLSNETMTARAFREGRWRAAAQAPGIKQAMQAIDPAATVSGTASDPVSVVQRGLLIRARVLDTGDTGRSGGMALLQERTSPFTVGAEARIGNVQGKPVWYDLFDNPSGHKLTREQQDYITLYQEMVDDAKALAKENNIPLKELNLGDERHYIPRLVEAIRGIENERSGVVGGRVGAKQAFQKTRFYEWAQEGVAKGVVYSRDPLSVMDFHVKGVYRAIADKRLADEVASLGETVLERVEAKHPGLLMARDAAKADFTRARELLGAVNRAYRGERLPPGIIQKIGRSYPQEAAMLKAAGPDNPALQTVEALAKQQMQASRDRWKDISLRVGRIKEALGTPGFDEGWVPQPAFQGRIFSKDVADRLNTALGDMGNKWLAALEKPTSFSRTIGTIFDFGSPFIQGLPVLGHSPHVWARATLKHYQAFLQPESRARYFSQNLEVIQEMAQNGVTLGESEFFAGSKPASALLKLLPEERRSVVSWLGKQTLGRFQESFGTLLDVAAIEMWKALRSRALREGPDSLTALADVVQHMRGTMSQRGIGIGTTQQQIEGVFGAFAPRYTKAGFALMADALQGGIKGEVAREALAGMAGTGFLMFLAVGAGLTALKVMDVEDFKDRLRPIKNGRFNAKFMTIPFGESNVGFGSFYYGWLKLVAGSIDSALNDPEDFLSLDTRDNPILQFAAARLVGAAPLTSLALELGTGFNYFGERLTTPMDYGKAVARRMMPFWAEAYLLQSPGQDIKAFVPSVEGFRVFPTSYGAQAQKLEAQLLAEQGLTPNRANRRAVIEGSPELQDLRQKADEQDAKRRKNPVEDQTDRYYAGMEREKGVREEGLATVYRSFLEGKITGEEFRASRGKVMSKFGASLETLKREFPLALTTREEREAYARQERLDTKLPALEDLAAEGYYNLDPPLVNGVEDMPAFFKARDKYLQQFDPATQDYIKHKYPGQRFEADWMNELERKYQDAMDTLRPYWQVKDEVELGWPGATDKAKAKIVEERRDQLRGAGYGDNPINHALMEWYGYQPWKPSGRSLIPKAAPYGPAPYGPAPYGVPARRR